MSIHLILGRTIGNEKIIKRLQAEGNHAIIVVDEAHSGPPIDEGDLLIYSPTDAAKYVKMHKDVIIHAYRCRSPIMNIDRYEF
ncbi:hypothetical protein [Sporosarcina cyprini]|uniref:hypothetical protein n=1 Tax=Sporosarcina cyprini TaxID=2910523 RepID=UPI001EDCE1A6|nr:hypothetical protein [Sporosarcina cyprini]MCG3086893.1 hypothetical protein [Sporosarcina cyprini]